MYVGASTASRNDPDRRRKLIRPVIWQPMARIRDHLMAEVLIERLQLPRRLDGDNAIVSDDKQAGTAMALTSSR